MKHIPTLALFAALLVTGCGKNETRSVEVRAECERCQLVAGDQSVEVWGRGSLYVKAKEGDVVSAQCCRHAPDTTINGVDTTIATYSGAISLWIFDNAALALCSDGAFYPDACAEDGAVLPDE